MIFATNQWCECLLQPKESEHREIKDLSGMWKFRADYSPSRDKGFQEKWYQSPLSQVIMFSLYSACTPYSLHKIINLFIIHNSV